MSKKGENIRKRKDGRWEARYRKGRKSDGSILYGYVYAAKYSEAKEKRDEAIRTLHLIPEQSASPKSVPTFDQLILEWEEFEKQRVRESSYFYYETIMDQHLRPFFTTLELRSMDTELMQRYCQYLSGKNLSASYIHTILILLKSLLKLAKQQHYLTDYPDPTFSLEETAKTTKPFSISEWELLTHYLLLQKNTFSYGLLLCMYTGLRVGEICGLTWGDFQWENGEITILRTVYRMKNIAYRTNHALPKTILKIGSPKTRTSRRTIPLPHFLLEKAAAYREASDCFVLTGTPTCVEPRTVQRAYKTILKCCGIPYRNFHTLRHSFATLGIQKGFDYKTLSEILGHSSVNTTLNIYVHSDTERKRQCIELLHN